jgi:hypothetical protein
MSSRAGVGTATQPAEPSTVDALVGEFLAELWQPNFPSADQVDAAAALIPDQPCGQLSEGPVWRVSVTPGRVAVWTKDEARAERTANRQAEAGCAGNRWEEQADDGEHVCTELCDLLDDELPTQKSSKREITGWSAKSRRNMCARLSDLDYAPLFADRSRLPGMLTLTYPADWQTVAPDGKTAKKHLDKLRKRYLRAYREPLTCVWKLEFQRRGAPHFHLLIRPPRQLLTFTRPDGTPTQWTFKKWVSQTWAEIVAHPDPEERRKHIAAGTRVDYAEGMRASDPRKLAVYFAKHGAFKAKDYQNCVPTEWQEPGKGPGRFWGYWHLEPVVSTRAVSREIGAQAGRMIRRYSRAQRVTREVTRPRTKGGGITNRYGDIIGLAGAQLWANHQPRYRTTRVRAVRAKDNRGWLAVNNGPDFACELGYALHLFREQRQKDADRKALIEAGWWNEPLARARRLSPSPRRDALIARLESGARYAFS